jgi:adenylate kinase family enzyme
MGIPGSGKTTLARSLAVRRHGLHIAASTILRDHSLCDPSVGERWRILWADGQMAPDAEVLPVLWQHYLHASLLAPTFLDGYPRTVSQLDHFWDCDGRIDLAVLLELEDSIATDRLARRRQAERRPDDQISVIRRRIVRAKRDIITLATDRRISEHLVVLECGELNEQEALALALNAYDAHALREPKGVVE